MFSQFTSHLALVRDALDRAGYHARCTSTARRPAAQRAKPVDAFQAGEADVFLISLKAGGTGLNLTAADYVIHLDPWWNPAVEDQATDRAHRIGQTKPVTVYRLVARGTIEEQILALHGDKRALVAGVLDGTDVAARLTTKDLLALARGARTRRRAAVTTTSATTAATPRSHLTSISTPRDAATAPDAPRRHTMRRMYHEIFRQMNKQLGQLDKWLDAAAAFAEARKVEPTTILGYRLAPDQFPLVRQVRVACDTAKLAASRLTGKDAPTHPDTEQTIEELQARVRAVRAYLDGLAAGDFADAATRVITQPRWEGKVMTGADYFLEHALPNFFFHVNHAYAILRHIGVPLGKRDYLGALTQRAP